MTGDTGADWAGYYAWSSGSEPRPMLLAACKRLGAGIGRLAVDLGCGEGTDALALLDRGWSVLAIDIEPAGLASLRARIPAARAGQIRIVCARHRCPGLRPGECSRHDPSRRSAACVVLGVVLDRLILPSLPTLPGERVVLRGHLESDVDDRLRHRIDPEEEDGYGSSDVCHSTSPAAAISASARAAVLCFRRPRLTGGCRAHIGVLWRAGDGGWGAWSGRAAAVLAGPVIVHADQVASAALSARGQFQ